MDRVEIERKIMSETVVEKTWEIPAHGSKGPVTVTLRVPQVTVTDSRSRHLVTHPHTDVLFSGLSGAIWCSIAPLSPLNGVRHPGLGW